MKDIYKEYWVNIINDEPAMPLSEKTKYRTREACKKFADDMGYYFHPVLYRIHVKMKHVEPKYVQLIG